MSIGSSLRNVSRTAVASTLLRGAIKTALLCAAFFVGTTPWSFAADAAARQQAATLNNVGTSLMGQQLLQKAEEKFDAAYKADPTLSLAETNKGIALLYLQKLPEAKAALEHSAQQAPNDPHTWYVLGLLYRSQNQLQDGIKAFQRVVALAPANADSHYFLGSFQFELHDLPASVAEYQEALKLNPLHASAEFGMARALQRQGKTAEARAAFDRFKEITTAKLATPFSHNYGEEGSLGTTEDAPGGALKAPPMIPVTFSTAWSTPADEKASASQHAGACLIDLDGSGHPSLVLMGHGENAVRVFRNSGAGGFSLLTPAETGLAVGGDGVACAAGDFDNDGLPDLALAMSDRVLLFRNLGNGKFADVTKESGITPANHPSGLIFVDFDHDGDLDLFVTGEAANGFGPNVLWRNNGNKTFTEWTKPTALSGSGNTTQAVLSDLNNDRAVDLLVTGPGAPTFYANPREGAFHASPLYTDAALPPATGVTVLDFNKDGWMDVALTHAGAPGVTLWRNVDGKRFERVPLPLNDATRGYSVAALDVDNDGWIDLAALIETANGPTLRVFRNLGADGFADVTAQLKLDAVKLNAPRSLLAADIDGDGAADLLVTQQDGTALVLHNEGGSKNHSLRISLKGLADNKSAIGTKVQVFANDMWQKWEVTTPGDIIAGIGSADKADLVRLLWPTGVPQDEIDVSAAKRLALAELDRRGSSCPTLFAWDGSKFTFVADVIGAGVVGHWVAPRARNTPDPDEWIKIDGAQLKARAGRLALRFGEPMEEVNYIDQVRLVAVDHPAGTEVYPHEGFLSERPFATGKTIVSAHAHLPLAAWDDHGNNVLPQLARIDHTYVRDFTNLSFAGFANQHTLTLDLGAWNAANPLRLLLHGYVEYFSASSMYAAWQAGISPVPPYVEAQLADGSWKRVVNDMGFPAGLPRTVVVDLTGKLPAGTRRIRITTNLQIYWDQALIDNDPAASSADQSRQTELPLASASLAFRGYPQQLDGKTPGDLNYNYQHISQTGPFIPQRGAYTRYGNVTPLLRRVDDEYVIFGTGEDMDLEFNAAAAPALPKGWVRDYFFYANGFVKDMDFYEASPFTVSAMPFHGMTTYPYPSSEQYPSDAAHIAYQLQWNNRFESGEPAATEQYQFDYVPTPSAPDAPGRSSKR